MSIDVGGSEGARRDDGLAHRVGRLDDTAYERAAEPLALVPRHDLGVSEDDAVASRPVVEPPLELTLDSELEAGAFRVVGDGRRLYGGCDATAPVRS
jgi:hypothetical protein